MMSLSIKFLIFCIFYVQHVLSESFLPDEKQAEVLPLNREQPPSHLLSLFTLVPRCSEGFTPNKLFRLLWDTDTSCYFTHNKSVISALLLLPLPLTLSTLELTMDVS
ncbi:hypothetical protein GQX74_012170 [Glossina fuscipes]|nr:hypothetical protein GQX74_012170 [Glossina fuscipes]